MLNKFIIAFIFICLCNIQTFAQENAKDNKQEDEEKSTEKLKVKADKIITDPIKKRYLKKHSVRCIAERSDRVIRAIRPGGKQG